MKKQNLKYISYAKYIASSKKDNKTDRILDDIIKIIGAISGATVIFAALFYIFGSNYAAGYFGAMNIPLKFLSFTIWEYSSYAWFPLLFIIFQILLILIYGVVFEILLFKPVKGFQEHKKRNKRKELFAIFINTILQLTNIFIIILVLAFFILTILYTKNYGTTLGKMYLLEDANMIDIHSTSPISIDGAQVVISGNGIDEYFIYSGFRLLTKNDGKYYLFKELDPETCKPKQVYIIDESKIDQVILSPAEDISDQCNAPVNP